MFEVVAHFLDEKAMMNDLFQKVSIYPTNS